ncbi:TRAP transporter substrate-binding protein [Coraliomargarita algicola]|uniref:TRAP transporter substrate-binding protein n=1 Tax=Coraliomargarita algicola TaxID=3092156 RepID=A0ABZ0RPV1_9BACT|nr:TRAP transporter substrate-binding protein [Coraliomargarita sp. J2-16]WPJ97269.1 TRAP transporter substrate-binding protein [Coraliomargarita sp. J2-16]
MNKNTANLAFGVLLGVVAASLLFAFFDSSSDSGGASVHVLKVAHNQPTTHPVHLGIQHMAERVAALSGGRMRLDVFPNGQLGSETQTMEQLQAGTLDIAKGSSAPISNFISVCKVFSLPYLFRDEDHFWAVLNGEVGAGILESLATNDAGRPSGLRGLTYYDAGSRSFYAKKAIHSPADLAGMKIRVQNDPVAMDMVEAMGAAPTPVAWGELYTALQQGVVDGAENNSPSFVSSRHFEVCKQFSLDHHARVPDVLLMSSLTWNRLSEQEQAWLSQAAAESSTFQRAAWAAGVAEAVGIMKEEGVQVVEVNADSFIEATQSVRDKYATGPLRELVVKIGEVE